MSAYIAIHLQKQIREHFYECCAYCKTAEFLTAVIANISLVRYIIEKEERIFIDN